VAETKVMLDRGKLAVVVVGLKPPHACWKHVADQEAVDSVRIGVRIRLVKCDVDATCSASQRTLTDRSEHLLPDLPASSRNGPLSFSGNTFS
jgi:hypothetical protein